MGLARVHSRAQIGLDSPGVAVEVHTCGGLPVFNVVGLAETTVKESRDRVRAALKSSGFEFPKGRITVNLAPADMRKEGGRFDLAIALGILAASAQLRRETRFADHEFFGELGLGGELRAFRGALPVAMAAQRAGRALVLPRASAAEAAVVTGARVLQADHLNEVVQWLVGQRELEAPAPVPPAAGAPLADLADVRGQQHARRALEIAAAGSHNLLLIGPPGTGKSMLALRLPGLLPPMCDDEALESAALHSLGSGFDPRAWRVRPFRAPHHTASAPALAGGGSNPRPGEISLAHNGVLFLDELPEFSRHVLEVLRQPLENGRVAISRAAVQVSYPARFQLVAAMNPCPCGYLGDGERCCCSDLQVQRYRDRISGPLLDRIDLHVEMPRPAQELLRPDAPPGEATATVVPRVLAARERQQQRAGESNAQLAQDALLRSCHVRPAALTLLDQAVEELALSARAYHRVLRVARTIADLAASPAVLAPHVAEAIALRRLSRRPPSA